LTTEYSLYCLTLNQNQFEQLISQKYFFFFHFSFKEKTYFYPGNILLSFTTHKNHTRTLHAIDHATHLNGMTP
jgi:hypothetical protein